MISSICIFLNFSYQLLEYHGIFHFLYCIFAKNSSIPLLPVTMFVDTYNYIADKFGIIKFDIK